MTVWINGRPAGGIDPRDRGLQYGDGLFETLRVTRRAPRLLDAHLQRLLDGCRRLGFDAPAEGLLRRELERAAGMRREGVLKLIVTRGVGARGYRPTGRERATRILSLHPLPAAALDVRPIRLRICNTRLGTNPRLAGLKTLNRLESVLARAEWSDPRFAEGLMCDADENIVCGTMSNVFMRQGRRLVTPLLDRCGVAGVMRRWILERAPSLGLRALERRLSLSDLERAEEVFMSNAVNGPVPVAGITHSAGSTTLQSFELATQLRTRLDEL
jgi:4-amino-4-deoxychorismate lyase